jgi:oxygen-independent coproporphyrinogen-3 oxidase
VHVPFCASTCDFCAFYQVEPTAAAIQGFLDGVEAESALVDWPRPVTTVFFGGGTPGLLNPRDLARLIGLVRARTGGTPLEWTIELAPGSVTAERLAILRAGGVNRVSLGVQSFQPDRLEALGRRHTREQVLRAYERIRAAGCENVNLDLMFALPGQTEAEWSADVDAAVALAPEHLSAYCLTFEEDTAMWIKLAQGRVKLDPEKEARFYEAGWGRLADAGYAQYEISNFSRPGFECRHNRNTWRMNEWIGLGPAAASQHGGRRGANIADLERWRANLARGERMTEDRIEVTPALLVEDALIFGLRMNEGVDVALWRGRCPTAPWTEIDARIAALVGEGLAWREGGRIGATARGRLLADAVGGEFFGVAALARQARASRASERHDRA